MKREFDKNVAKFRRAKSDYRKTSRILECFYHDKSQCKGNIKKSHSLQRNGRLSIIEGDVNGNKVVYSFTDADVDASRLLTLKPIGKAEASTFFGFCDYHDTSLFSAIENNRFDNSDKHCFLHSYRSFAHSYHRKKEEFKAYQSKSRFTQQLTGYVHRNMLASVEVGLKESNESKQKIDDLIANQTYDGLEYFMYVLPDKYPIACSSQISPYYSPKNRPINNHRDPNVPFSTIMLTVLPDFDQTIVIFACFPDDHIAVNFLDELDQLADLKLNESISSMLINCAENTFIAPALWNALGQDKQQVLCRELRNSSLLTYHPNRFERSQINLLDTRFSAKALGIE